MSIVEFMCFFFFKQKTAYEMRISDWSSDVCSSDLAQGDFRPMAGNNEAMADLKRILASREAFYSKADYVCSTSHHSLAECFDELRSHVRQLPDLALEAKTA